MKALIVDDEKHVRDAIRLLVPWAEWGIETILEAGDGQTAAAWIERERPELIFTDMMMPVMDGVELLRWLHEREFPGKTIVISGYDDFALARHTIRYGGLDYILKPVEREQLIKAVDQAVSAWRREEEQRKVTQQRAMEINRLKPVYWDKVLSQLLEDPQAYRSLAGSLTAERGLPAGTERIRVAVLSLDGVLPASLRSVSPSPTADEELHHFAVMNVCGEILGRAQEGMAFRNVNRREIVLLFWDGFAAAEERLGRIQEGLRRTLRASYQIGLGSVLPFPEGLKPAYKEARLALQRRNLLEAGRWLHVYEPEAGAAARRQTVHLSEYHEALRLTLYSGQPTQLGEAVRSFVRAAAGSGSITAEQLAMWQGEWAVLRSQWVKEWFGDDGAAPGFSLPGADAVGEPDWPADQEGRLQLEQWEEQLTDGLIRFVQTLHAAKQQANNVILEIRKYIEAHYREEISLQDIAGHFFLSREYISRKFKQELNVNLSDYIVRIRMEKAQQLLGNAGLKVAQIAQMVGYQDEKYFSKVFKKSTGLAPNEYRKGQGAK